MDLHERTPGTVRDELTFHVRPWRTRTEPVHSQADRKAIECAGGNRAAVGGDVVPAGIDLARNAQAGTPAPRGLVFHPLDGD